MVIPKPNTLLESFDYFRLGDWNNAVALVSKLMISFFSFYFFFSYVYLGQMYLSKKKGKKRKQGKRGVSEGAAFLLDKKDMHFKERCWMIRRILGCFKNCYVYAFYYMMVMYFFLSVLHFAAVGENNNISHQLQPAVSWVMIQDFMTIYMSTCYWIWLWPSWRRRGLRPPPWLQGRSPQALFWAWGTARSHRMLDLGYM